MSWWRRRSRRLSFGSNLRRAEWGMTGRHRHRTRRAAIAGGALLVVALGAGAWALWIRGDGGEEAAPKPRPSCDSAKFPGRLGQVAWVQGGRLQLFDLDRCTQRVLVRTGARSPVRFSPDGGLIAYGDGAVVPVRGGSEPQHPAGKVATWQWSPSGDLAGVTKSGQVVVTDPSEAPTTLIRHGAGHVAFSPSGRDLAVDLGNRVAVVPTTGGSPRTLFATSKDDTVEVVGWAPGGKWVLFFVQHPKSNTALLDAVPVGGGAYHNVFDPVLPYADFVSSCGDEVVVSGGGKDTPSEGQQLLVSTPPLWQTHNLSADFRSSWFTPSCSPDGKWIAATVTPNHTESPPGRGKRSVEVVAVKGQPRVHIAVNPKFVFEAPRWSSDGRVVMVVRRFRDPGSSGSVALIRLNEKREKVVTSVGSIVQLGPAPNRRGHFDWLSISDWYRPPREP